MIMMGGQIEVKWILPAACPSWIASDKLHEHSACDLFAAKRCRGFEWLPERQKATQWAP